MRQIQITHTDLDGYGCEFIARQIFPDITVYNVDYEQFTSVVEQVLADHSPETLIISDIWSDDLSKAALDALCYFKGDLLIFDHHPTAQESQNQLEVHGATVLNETGECGTLKMAHYYDIDLPAVNLVNKYDLTGTIEGDAGKLNMIFWEYINNDQKERIFDMLGRDPFFFNKHDEETYQEIAKKQREYYKEVVEEAEFWEHNDRTYAFVNYNNHQAFIAKTLLAKDVDMVIMYSLRKPKMSFRSIDPIAGPIAISVGGGGHDQAAGAAATDKSVIKQKIKELL